MEWKEGGRRGKSGQYRMLNTTMTENAVQSLTLALPFYFQMKLCGCCMFEYAQPQNKGKIGKGISISTASSSTSAVPPLSVCPFLFDIN
mmetsp:Transcript_44716/g.116125  ORF Transcript_44716/g.116125 Transcript_44716/m.116125 type:complete len:89 (-) Transcript_44716:3-269(-)